MPDPVSPEFTPKPSLTQEPSPAEEFNESFEDALSDFERTHAAKKTEGSREGTVVSISSDSVVLDVGLKTEGVLPLSEFNSQSHSVKAGDLLQVTIRGRDPEGYYQLTLSKAARPTDWAALERAFADKATIAGVVTAVVKGGLSVDVGVRAFMPASRSGARDAAEMAKLVEQEIRCRIIKLDAAEEDLVVDRRVVMEEGEQESKTRRYSEVKEGDIVKGTVRSLAAYGAFVDIGGVDALLHVSDISWGHVTRTEDVLEPGQEIDVKILKIDLEKHRISVGAKQLQPHPWDSVPGKYKTGERVRGTVTRLTDFGAFVEIEPGIEGLIHVSEMSWVKKVRKPGDLLKVGDAVEVVILAVNSAERRMSLGLKQTLGDPWTNIAETYLVGSVVEGQVVSLEKFGAFVQIAEGIEGMIHVSDMSAEKRIEHPHDMVKVGQSVKAQVLEIDAVKRRLKLGMKQLVPTGIDEYLAEHKEGDIVTGRVAEVSGPSMKVELGEGIRAECQILTKESTPSNELATGKADLSSLSSMLQARWKGGTVEASSSPQYLAGQVRSFRITRIDREAKRIELEIGT